MTNLSEKVLITCMVFLTLFFFWFFLIIAKSVLVPFVFAIFITVLILFVVNRLRKHDVNIVLIYMFIVTSLVVIWYFIYSLVMINVDEFIEQMPYYQNKFEILFDKVGLFMEKYHIIIQDPLGKIDIQDIVSTSVTNITWFGSDLFLIALYTFFLIWEKDTLYNKMIALVGQKHSRTIANIRSNMEKYIYVKTLVSLMTWVSVFVVLKILWVDFAVMWSVIVFVFNFIPNIGSIIAWVFILIFAMVELPFYMVFILWFFLFIINMVLWNIVEPKIFGKILDINPLIVILAIVSMGSVWGMVGMILAVPIMSTINIVSKEVKILYPLHIILRKS